MASSMGQSVACLLIIIPTLFHLAHGVSGKDRDFVLLKEIRNHCIIIVEYNPNFYPLSCMLIIDVRINNDGPALLGTPITFTAEFVPSLPPFLGDEYQFTFKHDVYDEDEREINTRVNKVSEVYNFHGPKVVEGEYTMHVVVYQLVGPWRAWVIARGAAKFRLSISIPGRIKILQEGIKESALERHEPLLATNRTTTIIAEMHDPSRYFTNWTISYNLIIGNQSIKTLYENNFTYIFDKVEPFVDVKVVVTAKNETQKEDDQHVIVSKAPPVMFGEFRRRVQPRQPIDKLIINGKYSWNLPKFMLIIFHC